MRSGNWSDRFVAIPMVTKKMIPMLIVIYVACLLAGDYLLFSSRHTLEWVQLLSFAVAIILWMWAALTTKRLSGRAKNWSEEGQLEFTTFRKGLFWSSSASFVVFLAYIGLSPYSGILASSILAALYPGFMCLVLYGFARVIYKYG